MLKKSLVTKILISCLWLISLGLSCAPPNYSFSLDSSETACQAGNAVIQVLDGSLLIRCGCTQLPSEAPGTVFTKDETLTCHLASRQGYVLFLFANIKMPHQINFGVLTGVNPLASGILSNISNPTVPVLVPFNFTFPSSTYTFEDVFFPGIQGQIFVP